MRSTATCSACRSSAACGRTAASTAACRADFRNDEHGLTKLRVAARGGVVFATFDPDVEPLEDFIGPTVLRYFDRLFDGRTLEILGYNRQRIPGNWKLMQENIKDPYHPGLLHTWFVTFGLWRADNKAELQDGRALSPRRDDLDARPGGQVERRHAPCRASRTR